MGHGAILHACTIEDGAFVGMGATVMDGAVVQRGAMVAAGALVTRARPPRCAPLLCACAKHADAAACAQRV